MHVRSDAVTFLVRNNIDVNGHRVVTVEEANDFSFRNPILQLGRISKR